MIFCNSYDREIVQKQDRNAILLSALSRIIVVATKGAEMHDIGRMLKEGRVARGLEIGDIAKTTCISAHYLKDMEEGLFNRIPNVFDRGYLKIYARFLNIDTKMLLARYEQQKNRTHLPG